MPPLHSRLWPLTPTWLRSMTHSRLNSDATSTTLSDAPTCNVSLERPVLQVLLPWWIREEEDIRGEALRGPCLTTNSSPGSPQYSAVVDS